MSCHVISTHLSNAEELAEVAAAEKAEKEAQDAKEALEAKDAVEAAKNKKPVVFLSKKDSKAAKKAVEALQKKKEDDEEKRKLTESANWYVDEEDGMIRPKPLDVTIKSKGLDGKWWVWRLKKRYDDKMYGNEGRNGDQELD